MPSCAKLATAVFLIANAFNTADCLPGHTFVRKNERLQRPSSSLNDAGAFTSLIPERRNADAVNASSGGRNSSPLKTNGTSHLAAWNASTDAACMKAMSALGQSSNPSGFSACYNLPSLDTATGVFEAELRLYRVSEPRDEFASVPRERFNISISYHNARVSPEATTDFMGLGQVANRTRIVSRDTESSPELLQTFMFLGQINRANMSANMPITAYEALLLPTLTVSASNATAGNVRTNVSLDEASFLTGVFSKSVVLSDFDAAQQAVDKELDALHSGASAFVLPGVQILIFPIGTVITSVWLVLGLVAYGFGTWQRIAFAKSYQRRLAAAKSRKTSFTSF